MLSARMAHGSATGRSTSGRARASDCRSDEAAMYVPSFHQETDTAVLHALMRAQPLGTWVTPGHGELIANHIPFLLDASRGEHGTLLAHVARANPARQQCRTHGRPTAR